MATVSLWSPSFMLTQAYACERDQAFFFDFFSRQGRRTQAPQGSQVPTTTSTCKPPYAITARKSCHDSTPLQHHLNLSRVRKFHYNASDDDGGKAVTTTMMFRPRPRPRQCKAAKTKIMTARWQRRELR
ncbi:hypothetical protein H4582DRAFT_2017628 [Lactarius indigo]|nr:hypothetical protein H4582DRAFT_2019049 [Lactarius indigo]KAI9430433.1 hypothetical protein H4582DRAFT_2017628 [Lactarius indigo]